MVKMLENECDENNVHQKIIQNGAFEIPLATSFNLY